MPLFDRLCKIIVGTGGSTTEDDFLVFDQNFRITFDILINGTSANQCTVKIYNLSRDNRQKVKNIIKDNARRQKQKPPLPFLTLQVLAGYKEGDGLEFLFYGDIIHPELVYQPPDYITTITAYGAAIDFQNKFTSIAYSGGIDTTKIIKQLAKDLEMTIDKASDFGRAVQFANGMSLSGQVKDSLDKMIKIAGLRYVVTANNALKFSPIAKPSGEEVLLLSPETGVINPVKELDDQGLGMLDIAPMSGWEVDTLLQPKALVHRRVQLETKEVSGIFFIDSVEHKGDTRGNEWMSVLQVREFKTPGV